MQKPLHTYCSKYFNYFKNHSSENVKTENIIKCILDINNEYLVDFSSKIRNNPTWLNATSDLEIGFMQKGLLILQVALTSTTAVAPLSTHITNMNLYNTATTGDVTPWNNYNDGTKWVKIADEANTTR